MRRPFPFAVLAIVLITALGLVSGSPAIAQSPDQVNPAPDLTAARALVRANPLHWEPCAEIFACATLTVSLDYSGAVPGTTTLAVTRLPAADPARRIGSLVVNYGGPGAAVVETLHALGLRSHPEALQARFDIVGIDPRGIGQSTPLDCRLRAAGLSFDQIGALNPEDGGEW